MKWTKKAFRFSTGALFILAGITLPNITNKSTVAPRQPVHFGKYALSAGTATTYWPYTFLIQCYYSATYQCPYSNGGGAANGAGYTFSANIPQLEPNAQLTAGFVAWPNAQAYQETQYARTYTYGAVANGTAAPSNTFDGSIGNGNITYSNVTVPPPPNYAPFNNGSWGFINGGGSGQVVVTSHTPQTGQYYVWYNGRKINGCDGSANWAWTLNTPQTSATNADLTPSNMNIRNASSIANIPWQAQNPGPVDELQVAQPNTWCIANTARALEGSYAYNYNLGSTTAANGEFAIAALGTEENISTYLGNNPWVFNGWSGDNDSTAIGSADAGLNIGLGIGSLYQATQFGNAYDENLSLTVNNQWQYVGGGTPNPVTWYSPPVHFGVNTIGVVGGWTTPASEANSLCGNAITCTPTGASLAPQTTLYWGQYQNAPTVTTTVSTQQAFLGSQPTATATLNYVPQNGTITWTNSQGQTIGTTPVSASASPSSTSITLSSSTLGNETYTATYQPSSSAYIQPNGFQPYNGPFDYVTSKTSLTWIVGTPTLSISQNPVYIYSPVTVSATAPDVPSNAELQIATDPSFSNIVCSTPGTGGVTQCNTTQTYDTPTSMTYYVRTISNGQAFSGLPKSAQWVDPTIHLAVYSDSSLSTSPTQNGSGIYRFTLGSPAYIVAQTMLDGSPVPWTYAPNTATAQEKTFLNNFVYTSGQGSSTLASCTTWPSTGVLSNSSSFPECVVAYSTATEEGYFADTSLVPSNTTTLNFQSNVVGIQWSGGSGSPARPT